MEKVGKGQLLICGYCFFYGRLYKPFQKRGRVLYWRNICNTLLGMGILKVGKYFIGWSREAHN